MSNKEVLEKVIQKAIDGGWDKTDATCVDNEYGLIIRYDGFFHNVTETIFSHEFAKALWGNDDILVEDQPSYASHVVARTIMPKYQFHLQQMVISPDPIKYLEENAL